MLCFRELLRNRRKNSINRFLGKLFAFYSFYSELVKEIVLFQFRFIGVSQINNKKQEQFGFRYFPIIFSGKNNLYPGKLNRNSLWTIFYLSFLSYCAQQWDLGEYCCSVPSSFITLYIAAYILQLHRHKHSHTQTVSTSDFLFLFRCSSSHNNRTYLQEDIGITSKLIHLMHSIHLNSIGLYKQ